MTFSFNGQEYDGSDVLKDATTFPFVSEKLTTMTLGSTHIHDEQERDIPVYRGTLTDGRVICVDKDVFEMSKFSNRSDDADLLNNPDEWVESLDGECVFIEGHFMEAK